MGNGVLKYIRQISRRDRFETCPYKRGRWNDQKGQASIEASVAFVVAILLLATIVKIWFWANNQIVERQISFNESRVRAGTGTNTYSLKGHWPLAYTPPALNEEDK